MIFKSIEINNEGINIKGEDINLTQKGIYWITGDNGSGKTTFIKKLIFGENDIIFNNEEHKEKYIKERFRLFTYLPQEIISYPVSIKNYILKGRKDIPEYDIINLMKKFKIDYLKLNDNFISLSGGEQVKVRIICALLKDTPYLFLDEPSNNLDDLSVEILCSILEEYAQTHSVILISHDSRMKFLDYQIIEIDGSKIISNNNIEDRENSAHTNKNKVSKKKIICNTIIHPLRLMAFGIAISMLIIFGMFIEYDFYENISLDNFPNKNIIMTYKVDEVYGELNEIYCKGEELSISESLYYNLISYDDVIKIEKSKHIDEIIIIDTSYVDDFFEKEQNGTLLDNINIIAEPQLLSGSFEGKNAYGVSENIILEGKLPSDEADEVAISKEVLKKFFGYTDSTVADCLGDEIKINEKKYKIVGITYIDACVVSYSKSENYGYYYYTEDSYTEFVKNNIHYKSSMDMINVNFPEYMYIFTSDGYEREILNELMQQFPAENYLSNYFTKVWVKCFNREHLIDIYIISAIVSLIIGIYYLFLTRKTYQVMKKKIEDYKVYYIESFPFNKYLYGSYLIELCVLLLVVISTCIFSKFVFIKIPLSIFNVFLSALPMCCNIIMDWVKFVKNNK